MGARLGTARARVVVGDWVGSLPAGVAVQLALDGCFSRRGSREIASEQRFPQEGVSRGNRLGATFPPGGGLSGKSPRSNVSPRRGSLGEITSEQRFPQEGVSRGNRLGATFPPGGGLSGKCRGSAFPHGGGLSGKSPRSNVSPRRGSLGEMAAERSPSPARGGPGGAGKCAEAQFVSGEARSAGGDTILRRPDKG